MRAEEPTPAPNTPPTPPPACGSVLFDGPATRTINRVQIDVPAGSYSQTIPPPGSPDGAFTLCHVQTAA